MKPPFELFSGFEKTAAEWAETLARDPRTLALGAACLRTHLAWRRAFEATWEALWAPLAATHAAGMSAPPTHAARSK